MARANKAPKDKVTAQFYPAFRFRKGGLNKEGASGYGEGRKCFIVDYYDPEKHDGKVPVFLCSVEGKPGDWMVRLRAGSKSTLEDLGPFKYREDAAIAYLQWSRWKPVVDASNEARQNRYMTNPRREGIAIPEDVAHKIYDILAEECGAANYGRAERDSFVHAHTLRKDCDGRQHIATEWRFCGMIGFGGKFRNRSNEWYVDCYPEERNPSTDYQIACANDRLQALYMETYGGKGN